jgi:hypothetical protein
MSENRQDIIRPDTRFYSENRRKFFPPEELAKYAGQEVAFSADGTRIIGHGPDFLTLWHQLQAAGLNPSEFVFATIPSLDEDTWLGGSWFNE